MGAFQNIGIRDYFKRYGYKYGLMRGIFMANPVHIVRDYENKKILYYRHVKKYICRKYSYSANNDPKGIRYGNLDCENPTWVYWKQGIEQAPPIVKLCIKSIIKYSENNLIILSDENISDYVLFPDYIIQKREEGTMSAAAFSDLLRFTLLEHFGGTWLDATVYLTDKLPEYILKSDLFCFRDSCGLVYNPALMSVWLLHSRPGNQVLRETRNIMYDYWKEHEYVKEYLLPYIVLTSVLEKYPNEISMMPYAISDYCHLMLDILNNEVNQMEYDYITSLSSVHKLSYKLSDDVTCSKNNLYYNLIKDEKIEGGGINLFDNQQISPIPFSNIYIVSDYENRKLLYYSKVDKILKRKYLKYVDVDPEGLEFGVCPYVEPIWVYWKQGVKNAPDIVKKCIESIHKWSDKPVIEIDETNIEKYITLPKEIMGKYYDRKISEAALSDLIRFSLLEHFGGIWLDATVYLTGNIPQYIINSDFFAFQDSFGKINNAAMISNWLLRCKPGNKIMRNARNMTFAYWKNENYVIEYLFTYILLRLAVEINQNEPILYPYFNSDYTHQYLNVLADEFSEMKEKHIKNMTSIHKLSYKLNEDVMNKNTFYRNLL